FRVGKARERSAERAAAPAAVADVIVRLHMRAIDETDGDGVLARFDFDGNLLEAVENLLPAVGAFHVREAEVFGPAERTFEEGLAVKKQHQGRGILERTVIKADREVKEADAVFAIGGKILLDFHAAAQTGCNWNFRVRVAGGLVAPTGNGRTHVAYGFLRDTAGRIEV